jgi:hypothetical protein
VRKRSSLAPEPVDCCTGTLCLRSDLIESMVGWQTHRNKGADLKATLALVSTLVMAVSPVFGEESAISLVAQLDAQYDSAWNTLDAHKLAEQFAADAIVLPQPRQPVTERRPCSTFSNRFLKTNGPITNSNRSPLSDWATASSWRLHAGMPALQTRPVTLPGTTATLLRPLRRSMANGSSKPPAGMCCQT